MVQLMLKFCDPRSTGRCDLENISFFSRYLIIISKNRTCWLSTILIYADEYPIFLDFNIFNIMHASR